MSRCVLSSKQTRLPVYENMCSDRIWHHTSPSLLRCSLFKAENMPQSFFPPSRLLWGSNHDVSIFYWSRVFDMKRSLMRNVFVPSGRYNLKQAQANALNFKIPASVPPMASNGTAHGIQLYWHRCTTGTAVRMMLHQVKYCIESDMLQIIKLCNYTGCTAFHPS